MTLVWLPSCLVKLYMGFGKYSNSCLTHERRVMDGDVATPGIIAELLSLFPLPIIKLPVLTNICSIRIISNQTISRRCDCLENNQTHDNHTRKLSRVKLLDLIMGKFHHKARMQSIHQEGKKEGKKEKGFLLHTEIRRPFRLIGGSWEKKKQSIDEEEKKKKLGGKDIKKCQSPEDKFLKTPPSLAPSSLELWEFFVSGRNLIGFDRGQNLFHLYRSTTNTIDSLTSRENYTSN